MKSKFSSIWRVSLALVLALSLGLVMAAPVSAAVNQPEVTVVPKTPADATAIYTIEFTTNTALTTAAGDTITVEFPAGTTLSTFALPADAKVNGVDASSVTKSGQRVSLTVGADVPAGAVTIVLGTTNKFTNPGDGDYTLKVYTSQEPTAVTSETYMISKAVTTVGQTLAPTTVAAAATYTITFTTAVELRTNDGIVIEFPVDTDISAVVKADVNVAGATVSTATPVGQVLTITLGSVLVTGSQTVTINNIINPTTRLNPETGTNEWKLTVYTTYGERIPVESASAYTLTAAASTAIAKLVIKDVDSYISNDTASTEMKVETQDQYGNPTAVGAETTITLSATPSGGIFSVPSVTILNNESLSGAFTFKSATAGTYTITAHKSSPATPTWTDGTAQVLVNPKLELWGGGELKASYKIFTDAIAAALPYDTIKFAPSTYDAFTVTKPYLTVESTGGKANTFISGQLNLTADADNFVLGGAVGKGFTLKGSKYLVEIQGGPTDVTISHNTLDNTGIDAGSGIQILNGALAGLTVTENSFIIADQWDMGVRGNSSSVVSGLTVTNNIFTGADKTDEASAVEINRLDITAEDTLISGNTFTAIGFAVAIGRDVDGGLITSTAADGTLEISGNDFDAGVYGINLINAASGSDTDQDVVITQNTFTGNTYGLAIAYSLYNPASDYLEPGDFTVRYNDFIGNTYAVYNNADQQDPALTAEHNYWGRTSGPSTTEISGAVDYTPWLNAPGGGPITTKTFSLYTGWNLISLPLIPTDPSIGTVLAGVDEDVTVNKVAYYTGGPDGSWQLYSPPPAPSDLTEMKDGRGYWIDVSEGGTFIATGVELALPGLAPPTYDVVAGWNLIGMTSIGSPEAQEYLGSVMDTVQAMYRYDAANGVYTAIVLTTPLAPGDGYWLAVNAPGKIYP